jgi:hypothetical protein
MTEFDPKHGQQRTEGQQNHHCAIDIGRQLQTGEWHDQASQDDREAEGQIAYYIEGREKRGALLRLGLRHHGSHRAGECRAPTCARDDGAYEHQAHMVHLDAR